MNKLIYKL